MKKLNTILMMIVMLAITIPAMGAMSSSKVRQNTRFLTDRMAYELNLTQEQYDDAYEVNYDFINNVRYIMSDVARGDYYAVDRYYDFLDIRNDDLRWILSSSQYQRFMDIEYFYRPIYTQNNRWAFRIYNVYSNINFFFYAKPYHYSSYRGGHYRTHYNNISFYKSRWNSRYHFHDSYYNYRSIRNDRKFDVHRRNDFGINPNNHNGYRPNENHRFDNNRDYRKNDSRSNSTIRIDNRDSRPSNSNYRSSNRSDNNSRSTRVESRSDRSRSSNSGNRSSVSSRSDNGKKEATRCNESRSSNGGARRR